MTLPDILAGWLPLVGGITGLAMLLYFSLMLYFARRREKDILALQVQVAEIRGLLFGRRKP